MSNNQKLPVPEKHIHNHFNTYKSDFASTIFFLYWFVTTIMSVPMVVNSNTYNNYKEEKGAEFKTTKYIVKSCIICATCGWMITPYCIGQTMYIYKNNNKSCENGKIIDIKE